ncbi:MAG: hypothetical protein MJ236_03720 [Clostridia bacterium]|nr:hypothetical protein [Clostridia bacterium]
MKSGANYLVVFNCDTDITVVESIIVTFSGMCKIKKTYPNQISYSNKQMTIPLTQEDTQSLAGDKGCSVSCEAQINYKNKSVQKTQLKKFYLEETLNTEIIEGNNPVNDYDAKEIKFEMAGSAIIATVQGDVTQEHIDRAVNNYLSDNPIEGLNREDVTVIIADYIAENEITGGGISDEEKQDIQNSIKNDLLAYIDAEILGGAS